MPSQFLAVDLGAGSGRVIVGEIGDRIRLEEIHRFPNSPIQIDKHQHWDIFKLFEEIKQGLTKTAAKGYSNLSGIGVDTWGVDFGLLDENDHLVSNPVCYRDARTNGMMEAVFAIMPKKAIFEHTGIQFMQFNTLFQLFSMVKSENSWLKKAGQLLFMPDLINFLLTGRKCSEYTIASTSQLLNARSRNWERTIFEQLEMPISIMSEIVQPGTMIGTLFEDIQKETGFNAADVIATAAHDTASAVAAVPTKAGSWAFLSSGTWSLIGTEIERPIISDTTLDHKFTNEGGVGQKIRLLRNVAGMWLLESCIKSWEQQNISCSYDELIQLAQQADPFQSIINPDDDLFLNPPDMPAAIRQYCEQHGLKALQERGAVVRSIFESLALKYALIIESMNNILDVPLCVLHVVGGGSQNELLNQFTANACGLPVVAGPVEATAVGNIMIQAISKQCLHSIQEGRELVAGSFPLKQYEPENETQWKEVFESVKDRLK